MLSPFSGGPRYSRLAPLGGAAARPPALRAALAALALLAMLARPPASRASRSMIARFLFLVKMVPRGAPGRSWRSLGVVLVRLGPFWEAPGAELARKSASGALRERFWEAFLMIFDIFWMFFACLSTCLF